MQYQQLIFLVGIVAVFYFLIIRPQQKRQKDQTSLMESLQPGAEIVTVGGIYGTIVSIDDDRVRISVADGSQFEIAKRAIGHLVPSALDKADEDGEEEGDAETPSTGDQEAATVVAAPVDDEAEVDSTNV